MEVVRRAAHAHLDVLLLPAVARGALHTCDALAQIHAVMLTAREGRGHKSAREGLRNGVTGDGGASARLVHVGLAQAHGAATITHQRTLPTERLDRIPDLIALVLLQVAVPHFPRHSQSLSRSRARFRAQVEHFAY